ncbi:MAG: DUF5615 family PIN-like protein [Pseudomonadota bacterium]
MVAGDLIVQPAAFNRRPGLIVDQNLPVALSDWLRGRRRDSVHVSEVGLSSHDDRGIADFAARLSRAVITRDSDFIAFTKRRGYPIQVVHARMGQASRTALFEAFEARWDEADAALMRGEKLVKMMV